MLDVVYFINSISLAFRKVSKLTALQKGLGEVWDYVHIFESSILDLETIV